MDKIKMPLAPTPHDHPLNAAKAKKSKPKRRKK
jgi:hypothetical protein